MRKLVLPGDELGTTEEFIGSEGTYEDNGKILAAISGVVEYDPEEMTIAVKPVTSTPVVLKPGDVVIGIVTELKEAMAIVEVVRVVGKIRELTYTMPGAIHISKVRVGYTPELGRAFRVGDIVRAKVIQTIPSLQLSTIGSRLGVIKSVCMLCRGELRREGRYLFCPVCEHIWEKKIAVDYGEGEVHV